jgi:hypothetical protein
MPTTIRRASRRLTRRHWRPHTRAHVRNLPGYQRGPDELAQALTAFRRAIRSHRRLARLAPRFFDAAVVERERREREDQRRWMEEWEPVIARAYAREPKPYDPGPDLPPLPPSHIVAKVDRELAAARAWMDVAHVALELYQQRRPHDLMSLTRMAQLLEISMDLRVLACGIVPGQPPPEPPNHDQACADLKRAYGHLCDTTTKEPSRPAPEPQVNQPHDSASVPPTEAPPQGKTHSENTPLRPPPVDSSFPPPAPLPNPRCDAYSRLARQIRVRDAANNKSPIKGGRLNRRDWRPPQ